MNTQRRRRSPLLLLLPALLLLLLALWLFRQDGLYPPAPTAAPPVMAAPIPEGTPTPVPIPGPTDAPGSELPVGKLVITPERARYQDGALTMRIPVLKVQRAVHSGTTDAALKSGVGLFEYAQTPGEGRRNVSLAGHRNGLSGGKITDRAPFYYVDTLKEGDCLYLSDDAHIYRYLYTSQQVVEPDDWSPIYVTGESCLTLVTCTPIGVSDHRLIIRATLDEILPLTKDYAYPPRQEEVLS